MTNHQSCLILFAKVPLPGQVKTRLCPPLQTEQAARLYAAFLHDIVSAAMAEPDPCRVVILAIHPWAQQDELRDLPATQTGLERMAQVGEDLGDRMKAAFKEAFSRGFARVVLRNTDSPLLPSACVEHAFEGLASPGVDVVLGPDTGGGYYLVGLRQARDELFEALPLESKLEGGSVFEKTLSKARVARLSCQVLSVQPDIDLPGDLERLRRELRATEHAAPQTARLLDELESEGVCFAGTLP